MYRPEQSFKQQAQRFERQKLSYGPQHTVTGGEVRLQLFLAGETIVDMRTEVGYTHRGIEKLFESRTWEDTLCALDRLGPPFPFSVELAFVEALERMFAVDVPRAVRLVRMLFCECERIVNHLKNIATVARYLGGETVYFAALRFEQYFARFCKKILGKGLFSNFFTPGGLTFVLNARGLRLLCALMQQSLELHRLMDATLFQNTIFIQRTQKVGIIPQDLALEWGLTGPAARGSGVAVDLRAAESATLYAELGFSPITHAAGDVYARCMVRFQEIRQSLQLVERCTSLLIESVRDGGGADSRNIVEPAEPALPKGSNLVYPFTEVYHAVEGPRGEFGLFLVGGGSDRLTRCKMNGASLKALQLLQRVCSGAMIADLGIIFRSMDISGVEVDR